MILMKEKENKKEEDKKQKIQKRKNNEENFNKENSEERQDLIDTRKNLQEKKCPE